MNNLTCEMVGFNGKNLILRSNINGKNRCYYTVKIDKPKKNIINYITYQLVNYYQENKTKNGFIAGIAYMIDGTAFMVYKNNSKLMSVHLTEKETGDESVIEYISEYINSKEVDGLLLLQEIEEIDNGGYHFRIIHENEKD